MFPRHVEVGEDDGEDEHVVHRQRPFDQVAGEKIDGVFGAAPPPDQGVERQVLERLQRLRTPPRDNKDS